MDYFHWAANRCARKEYTHREMAGKLKEKGASQQESDETMERLVAEGYINNRRYAEAFVSDKFRLDRWGRVKIRKGLRLKGVDDDDIEEALQAIGQEEYREAIRLFVESRRRVFAEPDDPRVRQKIAHAALARGYEPDIVAEFLQ